ncbi:hypothetical protein [Paraglaciecola sp. L3A3]
MAIQPLFEIPQPSVAYALLPKVLPKFFPSWASTILVIGN